MRLPGPFGAARLSIGALAALAHDAFSAAQLTAPPALHGALPPASPPVGMSLVQIQTGVTHRSAAFGYRGGSRRDRRDFAIATVLVKHPQGDLLVDAGFGRDIEHQILAMPAWFRRATRYSFFGSAADQLDAAGYDRGSLRAILATHAHWDHISGAEDFAGTPVWVTADERRLVAEGGWLTAVARIQRGVHFEEYGLEGGPYLGFPRSRDVYGDGSIVVVPEPGHSPGSVIVFLALPGGERYALVGDLAWQREGVLERRERPWLQRTLGDADAALVREDLLRMAAIAARFPGMVVVPAHDARAYAGIPTLGD